MFFQCRPRQPRPPPPPRPSCIIQNCRHKALECTTRTQGRVFFSLHCKDHACRQRLGAAMCSTAKDPGLSKYCCDHSRCNAEGCTQHRRFADSGLIFAYCQKHTCFLEGCTLKRAPSSSMCAVHTPLCLIPTCSDPRSSNGGLYCPAHTCADPDCDAVISAGSWCRAHAGCTVTGCDHPRAVSGPYCAEHTCAVHSCPKSAAGLPYCDDHLCQSAPCTNLIADPSSPATSRHCAGHTCAAPECTAPHATNGPCCPLHNAWLFEEVRPILPESPREAIFVQQQQTRGRQLTPAEEALERRLKQEQDWLRTREQLDRDLRRWNEGVPLEPRMAPERVFAHVPEPVAWEATRPRRDDRGRQRRRSRDSGVGSSVGGSDRTFIS